MKLLADFVADVAVGRVEPRDRLPWHAPRPPEGICSKAFGDVTLSALMPNLPDYEGLFIRLTEERWAHIRTSRNDGDANSRRRDEGPEVVIQSTSDPDARLYYRFYPQTLVGGKYLCAVVKVRGDDAFVVTAYLTDQVKKGYVLWQRKL